MARTSRFELDLRAQFSLAWSVWAGGYPQPEEALGVLRGLREQLQRSVVQHLETYLGANFEVLDLQFQIGGYRPIKGLWPNSRPPNSLDIFLTARATSSALSRYGGVANGIESLVTSLSNSIKAFSQENMPGARRGANAYDVEARWETRPEVSISASKEQMPSTQPFGAPTVSVRVAERSSRLDNASKAPRETGDTMSLAAWVDTQVEAGPGQSLYSLGPVGSAVHQMLQSEQHTSTLIANTFWQSYVHSGAFVRDLVKIQVRPTTVFLHEILVVAHGMDRYTLLLQDPNLVGSEVRAFRINARLDELFAGWGVLVQSHRLLQSSFTSEGDLFPVPLLAPSHVLKEVVDSQSFSVLVSAPFAEENTSVPSPHVPVSCVGNLSTAGVYVQDSMHRIGVTAAEHAVPPSSPVTVDRLPGTIISRDALTDSCFIHVPQLVPRPIPSHGPLRLAPRQHDTVTFEGAATKAGKAQIVAWNYELPAIDRNLQQTVRTDQVTSQGDSGAALLDSEGYIVGFAHSRSATGGRPTYSSWIWAAAVFQKHGLTAY
jgi:hypothetical protein